MNRTEILTALEKQCGCFFDSEGNEFWKCMACDTRDYIQLLVNEIATSYIGKEVDAKTRELLK